MSDIVERLRDGSELAMSVFELQAERFEAADEIERLRAYVGANEFRSDYKSADHMREEIERLRTELAESKTLLREALGAIYTYSLNGVSLHARIRAALGDDSEPVQKEPAGD